MTIGVAAVFAIASLSLAAEPARFAEDFPQGVGYAVILKILPDESGVAHTCELSGVHELKDAAPAIDISPPDAYVIDACRKLHNGTWPVKRDGTGNIEPQFYFCRYVVSSPNTAFCDRQFGE